MKCKFCGKEMEGKKFCCVPLRKQWIEQMYGGGKQILPDMDLLTPCPHIKTSQDMYSSAPELRDFVKILDRDVIEVLMEDYKPTGNYFLKRKKNVHNKKTT